VTRHKTVIFMKIIGNWNRGLRRKPPLSARVWSKMGVLCLIRLFDLKSLKLLMTLEDSYEPQDGKNQHLSKRGVNQNKNNKDGKTINETQRQYSDWSIR
jgi:hypothetical protein